MWQKPAAKIHNWLLHVLLLLQLSFFFPLYVRLQPSLFVTFSCIPTFLQACPPLLHRVRHPSLPHRRLQSKRHARYERYGGAPRSTTAKTTKSRVFMEIFSFFLCCFSTAIYQLQEIKMGYDYVFHIIGYRFICSATSASTISSPVLYFSCSLLASLRPSLTTARRSQVLHLSSSSLVTLPSR